MLKKYFSFETPKWEYSALITTNNYDVTTIIGADGTYQNKPQLNAALKDKAIAIYFKEFTGIEKVDWNFEYQVKEISFDEAFGKYCYAAAKDDRSAFSENIIELYEDFDNQENQVVLYDSDFC